MWIWWTPTIRERVRSSRGSASDGSPATRRGVLSNRQIVCWAVGLDALCFSILLVLVSKFNSTAGAVPNALMISLLLLAPILIGIYATDAYLYYSRLKDDLCSTCGYSRRGLAWNAKCPECGKAPTHTNKLWVLVRNARPDAATIQFGVGFSGSVRDANGMISLVERACRIPAGGAVMVTLEHDEPNEPWLAPRFASFRFFAGTDLFNREQDGKSVLPMELESGKWAFLLVDDERGRMGVQAQSFVDFDVFEAEWVSAGLPAMDDAERSQT